MTSDLQGVHDAARLVDAERWNDTIVASAQRAAEGAPDRAMPGFPSEAIQLNTNGRPAVKSLRQAFALYRLTMQSFAEYGAPRPDARFLDFGAGWGRIWRYFLRDFAPDRMSAFDVNPRMREFWSASMLGAAIDIGVPFEPLPFDDGTFDLVVSNSVFSHLSLPLNLHSAKELHRIMRAGGIFVGTTFGLSHLRRWREWQGRRETLNDRQKTLAGLADDFDAVIERYERGELIFLATNPARSSDYEITAFSADWVRANWSDWFELLDFVEQGSMQPVFICRAI